MNINKDYNIVDNGEIYQLTGDGLNMTVPKNSDGEMIDFINRWLAIDGNEISQPPMPTVKDQIQVLKQQRDEDLNSNTVDMLGHTFNASDKDENGLLNEITKGLPTLWPDVDDFMVEFTLADLEELLRIGKISVETIWRDYKLAVKAIQKK